jgi:beta-glucosidase
MGVAAVKGLQGKGGAVDRKHVLASLKHFSGHGQPESGINTAPANISERTLREVFFPPFKAAIAEAQPAAVMASYNEIDGVPSHRNPWLLQQVLRTEWGFKGMVLADYGGVSELITRHFVAKDTLNAAVMALMAGVDVELPDPVCYPALKVATETGMLPMTVLDSAVARVLRAKFSLGLFENPYVDPSNAERVVSNDKNGKLALEAAQKSVTLLKNNFQVLPVNPLEYKTIAVIGPNADRVLLGGYSDVPPYFISVLQGLRNRIGNNTEVVYSEGCRITEPGNWYLDPVKLSNPADDDKRIDMAIKVAQRSDLVILCLGGNELTAREAWSDSHLGDRTHLELLGRQLELLKKITETGKKVIVLFFGGQPMNIQYALENAHAVLWCWYLGQETGHAVADVLLGNVNPSGKLPCTFPRSAGHIPAYYNHKPTARRGYLFDDVSPLLPFGYGMSYTTFSFTNLRMQQYTIERNEQVEVSVDVTNTGSMRGDEVVQLYIRDLVSSVTRPVMELKGFEKVNLRPGQTKTVTFTITPDMLAFYNLDMAFTVEPGEFAIMVGNSSAELQQLVLAVK